MREIRKERMWGGANPKRKYNNFYFEIDTKP